MSLQSRIQSGRGEEPQSSSISDSREQQSTDRIIDPFAELKSRVHHEVITRLGPRLFQNTSGDDRELAERVGESVSEALAVDKTPLTRQERAQVTREITDDILGYGPLEPFLRDDTVTEVMVNGPHKIYIERRGKLTMHERAVRRRLAPAADHRQDHQPHRPPRRRGLADGRRAPARRLPRQRDHPAAVDQGPDPDDPEVPQGPLPDAGPDQVRHAHAEGRPVPRGLRPRQAEHPHLGRYGLRQDDHAERAVGRHPGRRAHHHRRGRRGAPALAGARDHARDAPRQHRGQGPGHDPRPRPEHPPDAPRPDHRRRVSWPGDGRHAPGHEHRPRRVADHDPREHAARRHEPRRDAGADGRRRPAAARHPRAVVGRVRPDRPGLAPRRRLPPHHAHHRGAADGVGRRDDAGHLLGEAGRGHARRRRTRATACSARCSRRGIKPQFLHKLSSNGVKLPNQFFQLEQERGAQSTAFRRQAS